MSEGTWHLIFVVAIAFGAGYAVVSIVMNRFARSWRRGDSAAHMERWDRPGRNAEEQYRQVLGLTGDITAMDVKNAYRELMAKYHPERAKHLGEVFRKTAARKTNEITAAYAYFVTKYNIKE